MRSDVHRSDARADTAVHGKRSPGRSCRATVGEVLRRAEAGEEFTVTVSGRPVARLGPTDSAAMGRRACAAADLGDAGTADPRRRPAGFPAGLNDEHTFVACAKIPAVEGFREGGAGMGMTNEFARARARARWSVEDLGGVVEAVLASAPDRLWSVDDVRIRLGFGHEDGRAGDVLGARGAGDAGGRGQDRARRRVGSPRVGQRPARLPRAPGAGAPHGGRLRAFSGPSRGGRARERPAIVSPPRGTGRGGDGGGSRTHLFCGRGRRPGGGHP